MVDTVLQFEGDQQYMYRILRSMKNRFGSTSEIGIYEMLQSGLRQVTNPSELLLSNHDQELSGIAVSATVEGVRRFYWKYSLWCRQPLTEFLSALLRL